VSPDLIWGVVRDQNSYLVKRKTQGGVQFSRDPLNLVNLHSRKHAGFVNDKAMGVAANEKGGVVVTSKKSSALNKPGSSSYAVAYGGGKSSRKTYKTIANRSAKSGYRPDLRQAAVARASAIRLSQKKKKETPPPKLRGKKASEAAKA